jgi:hypothetical protein
LFNIKAKFILFAFLSFLQIGVFSSTLNMKDLDTFKVTNKIIPKSIAEEVAVALSYYPELKDTPIEFRFKKKIKKSFMQAQPKFLGIFKNKKNRAYFVMISESFHIENESFTISEVPSDVLIGWIGHELGHIMDYQKRSGFNLIQFAIGYLTSHKFIKKAERAADTFAVGHGMGDYILATKDFILNHAHLSKVYKDRIRKLYLSPEEILLLVEELKD